MKFDFSKSYEEWANVLITELVSHLNIHDHKKYEAKVEVCSMDTDRILVRYKCFVENMNEEKIRYVDAFFRISYWIESVWPSFCVSYMLYDSDYDLVEDGVYQLMYTDGEGKCIPLE